MSWTKIDEMFPYGGIYTEKGFLSNKEILALNPEKLEGTWYYQAKDMLTKREKIIYFSNGNLIRYYDYNIYPKDQIEGVSILNDFGQKIFNDAIKEDTNELFE